MKGRLSIRIPGSIGDGLVLFQEKLSAPEIANSSGFQKQGRSYFHPCANLSVESRLDRLEFFQPSGRKRLALFKPFVNSFRVKLNENSVGLVDVDTGYAPNRSFKLENMDNLIWNPGMNIYIKITFLLPCLLSFEYFQISSQFL